jgi:glycosyltransferase involved in cell wall biosynthesis
MAAAPCVSVILPTYDRAHTLAASIRSVLEQTFGDFELIVVDDGSADHTGKVVGGFDDPRLRYIRLEANRGAAHARNVGLRAARGEYLAFQDSDDRWMTDKLSHQVEAMRKAGPDVGVVYSDMVRVNPGGGTSRWPTPEVPRGRLVDPSTHDYQVLYLGLQTVLARRSCVEEAGGFDEELPKFIDLDLFIRLSMRFRFLHLREVLVEYYYGPGISSDHYAEFVARRRLLEKYAAELPRDRDFLAFQDHHMGRALIRSSRFRQGRAYLFRSLAHRPGKALYLGHALASIAGRRAYLGIMAAFPRQTGRGTYGEPG